MIYFNEELVSRAVSELHDMLDTANDVNRIDALVYGAWTQAALQQAYMLDSELRRKYKTIDLMFAVANSLPKIASNNNAGFVYSIPKEIVALRQDRFGILADVLMKKGHIKEIKNFIDRIDG